MSRARGVRHGVIVSLGAVMTLLLVACGQSEPTAAKVTSDKRGEATESTAETTKNSESSLDPAAALAKATEATSEQKSFSMRMVTKVNGETAMEMTSITSTSPKASKSTIKSGEIGEMTTLMIDDVLYYQFPDLPDGKKWVKMDSTAMAGSLGIDPEALAEQQAGALDMLGSFGDGVEVEVVGQEKIDAVQTIHYRYDFDMESILKDGAAGGLLGDVGASALDAFTGKTVMNVWVGEDGLIRRAAYEMKGNGTAPNGAESMSFEMTYTDFNVTVDIVAPDPAETISMQELMTLGS